jgi:hypothetical protein
VSDTTYTEEDLAAMSEVDWQALKARTREPVDTVDVKERGAQTIAQYLGKA